MGLFGKSPSEKRAAQVNRYLKDVSAASNNMTDSQKKRVMYQCRYCGYKTTRYVTEGIPMVGVPCPRHPKGPQKGQHSWIRTFL